MTTSPATRRVTATVCPFLGVSLLAWFAVLIGSDVDWTQWWLSVGLGAIATALTVRATLGWQRGIVPSAFAYLAAVALLRNSVGGMPSGVGGLLVIPVFSVALYSPSRRDLLWVLAANAAAYLVPIVVVGGPAYPATQYRGALLTVLVNIVVGLTVQALVRRVVAHARDSRHRQSMLEQVSAAVHVLLESPAARADVCAAAREISAATVALLFEPDAGAERPGALVCTAVAAGSESETVGTQAFANGAVQRAFAGGEPVLVTDDAGRHVTNRELWERSGRPQAVLYQPLLRGDRTLAVLVVGWPDRLRADDPRGTIVTLLAHAAASVIARADVVETLTGEAQTDPLTGLPNRRAWDAALARAAASSQPLTVAMLDLDHFKEYNDTHGHPAGDRLLKATTAAWRGELRSGDLLARLGGEEFGLLLLDSERAGAAEVVERLRCRVPEGRTCSAGIATGRSGESGAEVLTRADIALYAAKGGGRDRIEVAI